MQPVNNLSFQTNVSDFPGRFEQVAFHRRGGMSEVFRAWDREANCHVAIKVCGCTNDARAYERFHREVRTLRELAHPRLTTFSSAGTLRNNVPYLATRFVEGRRLDAFLIHHHPVPVMTATTILLGLLEGLTALHLWGIVHRDVSPGNVLVEEPANYVRIIDLGLSKQLYANERELTLNGMTVGTPAYMAPEQAMGDAEPRSDVYSAALIFYELIHGRRPFAETGREELRHRLQLDAPPLAGVAPGIAAVIAKGLARHPRDRFASAAEMSIALVRSLSAEPTPERRGAAPLAADVDDDDFYAGRPSPTSALVAIRPSDFDTDRR